MLRKIDVITSIVSSRALKNPNKNGIEIPTDTECSKRRCTKNSKDFCIKSISKEMFAAGISFDIVVDKTPMLV